MYAVSQKDIRDSTPISSWKHSLILDSDEEDFEPRSKKERKEEKLNMILSEVGGIKEALGEMMTLSANSSIPMGLKRILRETFKCHICHTVPINPP